MPEMNGFEFIQEVHKVRPVESYAVTATENQDVIQKCLDAGFKKVINKQTGQDVFDEIFLKKTCY